MKKITIVICIAILLLPMLSSCTNKGAGEQITTSSPSATTETSDDVAVDTEGGTDSTLDNTLERTTVRVGVMKGPTAMGLVKFMNDVDDEQVFDFDYSFEIMAAIDEMVPKIVQGSVDIAAVPANMASVLYNNTQGDVQVIAINTLGMMYILETGDTVHSVEDLRGKTILASGKGSSVEFVLNYILSKNGIDPNDDVIIEWKSEHTECVAAFSAQDAAIAILPQPFVTIAQRSNENVRITLDLNEQWDKIQSEEENPSALITGVVIARMDFIESQPDAVADFLMNYALSVEYVNENVTDAAKLVGEYDIVPEPIAQMAIPYCNIVFIEGQEMREKLSGYLAVLHELNPQSVGGTLPDYEFYYIR